MLSSSGGSREGISPALLSSFIATGSFTLHFLKDQTNDKCNKLVRFMHRMLTLQIICVSVQVNSFVQSMKVICCQFLALGTTENTVEN